jgi:hypothetical protein
MSEFFSSQEDELNILFDKLTKTIATFTTLSRELAEKAIIETNIKIKEGEDIIEKMTNYITNNENKVNKDEMIELNKKINNYKNEFNNLVNKFNVTQNTYINKKAENALIDDIELNINNNNNKNDLIDDESRDKSKNEADNNKNNIEIANIIKNISNINSNGNNMEFEKNITNISGVNNNNISDEVFNSMNIRANKKKKKVLCTLLIILFIIIISFVLFIAFYTKNSKH